MRNEIKVLVVNKRLLFHGEDFFTDEHIDHEEEDSERDGDSISPRGAGGDAGAQQGGSGAGGGRFVRYHFSPQFLRLKQVGATLVSLLQLSFFLKQNFFLNEIQKILSRKNLIEIWLLQIGEQFINKETAMKCLQSLTKFF